VKNIGVTAVNHLERKVTLFDLAVALGVSTGTVHRALHDHRGVSPITKARVVQMAKSMGYRPNLAARYLSRREELRISVNTPKGTESYWDDVRAGIQKEAQALSMGFVELEFRTYPAIREGEEESFEDAIESGVNGIITFPSRPELMHKWMQRAKLEHIPVICVTTDAPGADRLAVVSINTMISGALAADMLGRVLKGNGKVAVTLFDLMINEHAEKRRAFIATLQRYYPGMAVVETIEDHEINAEAYEKCKQLFASHPDLAGIYVCNEVSLPVIDAARDSGILPNLSIITTDLFPPLVDHIRADRVLATIYQRPYTQGRMAFRVLHEFLVRDACPPTHLTLSPHLVMRGNLDYFLQQQSAESRVETYARSTGSIDTAELEG
jgi:LacI family transcriptional regulator